jgi:phosphoribosylformylglycinamidine synthase
LDLKAERALQDVLQKLAAEGLLLSARDVAEGGIATALAKMVFARGLGAEVELISAGLPAECVLFAEDATRVLLTCAPTKVKAIEEIAVKYGLNAQAIGRTTSRNFTVRIDGTAVIDGEAEVFRQSWRQALETALQPEQEAARV